MFLLNKNIEIVRRVPFSNGLRVLNRRLADGGEGSASAGYEAYAAQPQEPSPHLEPREFASRNPVSNPEHSKGRFVRLTVRIFRKSKFPAPSPSSLSLLSLDSDTMQEQRGNSNTPKAHEAEAEVRSGGQQVHTPPQSGSTTPIPTPVSDESRKSRFLALAPFTGFLRNRYPSTSRVSAKSVPEAGGGDEDGGDEEEDRSTIRGLVRDADAEEAAGHEAKVGVESAPTNPELKPQHGGHDIPLPESLAS